MIFKPKYIIQKNLVFCKTGGAVSKLKKSSVFMANKLTHLLLIKLRAENLEQSSQLMHAKLNAIDLKIQPENR